MLGAHFSAESFSHCVQMRRKILKEAANASLVSSPAKVQGWRAHHSRAIHHETLLLRDSGALCSMLEHQLYSTLFLFKGIVITKSKKKLLSLSFPAGPLAYFRGTLTKALQVSLGFLHDDLKKMKSAVELPYNS